MKNLLKRYIIKIPNDISIFYCINKKIVIFFGPIGKKTIILKTKILLFIRKSFITVTKTFFVSKISNQIKRKLKCIQKTYFTLFKQIILEISILLHNKLKFIGIGFKCFTLNLFKNLLLDLRLGFSHKIYFKIPEKIKIFCVKSTNIIIFGNSFQAVNQVTALIRLFKIPEVFKGKGILYQTEQIILKEGKKT